MFAEFLLTALIVVLVPGTGVLHTLSHGLFRGARAGVVAAFGCTLGILPHLLATLLGLAALLHASALAFQAVKWAGVAYLLYLAWGMWRETGTLGVRAPDGAEAAGGAGRTVARGLLINILNPKLSLFFLAFLPQFVPADSPAPLWHLSALAGVFMALTFAVFVGYALGAAGLRRHVLDRPALTRRLQRTFAALFALMGLRLAAERG